jgi:hypothetical protein
MLGHNKIAADLNVLVPCVLSQMAGFNVSIEACSVCIAMISRVFTPAAAAAADADAAMRCSAWRVSCCCSWTSAAGC